VTYPYRNKAVRLAQLASCDDVETRERALMAIAVLCRLADTSARYQQAVQASSAMSADLGLGISAVELKREWLGELASSKRQLEDLLR